MDTDMLIEIASLPRPEDADLRNLAKAVLTARLNKILKEDTSST